MSESLTARQAQLLQANETLNAQIQKTQEHVQLVMEAKPTPRKVSLIAEEADEDQVSMLPQPMSSSKASLASGDAGRQSSSSNLRRPTATSRTNLHEHGEENDPAFRYQRAQIRVLQDELAKLLEGQKNAQAKHDAVAAELERAQVDHNALSEHVQAMQVVLEKNKKLQGMQEAKQRMLDTDIASARVQVANTGKNEKQLTRSAKVAEVRLNECSEELSAAKKELDDEKSNQGGHAVPRHEHERALKDHQRLEKQKADLIAAFKLQIHLIDVLKRQKLHLETAKMLSFIEDEFTKTLETSV
ncbi:unnamed protein product [Aphanomyces euteiches]|nr:hypothetical protein Ae201684P_005060 [Aphanomyces euteiches]